MSDAPTWSDRFASAWPSTARWRGAAAGLVFSGSAALVALTIVGGYVGLTAPDYVTAYDLGAVGVVVGLPAAAGLAAAVAGAPLWWLVVERPSEPTALRGGIVGAIVGVVAHPLMWFLFASGAGAMILIAGGPGALVDLVVGDLASLVGAFALFSVVGLLLTGIVTVPVAAGTGVALAHVRRKAPGAGRAATRRRPQDL